MSDSYTVLPAFYDFLGSHPDYKAYAEQVLRLYDERGAKESGLILDLACGTGMLINALMDKGADVIGIDLSPEMLNVARENCAKRRHKPLLLCQDMRDFELYGTVDVCTCFTNSLNYLENEEELNRVFSLVHNYLTPGGLFFFDVNSLYKFEKLYGENCYVFETGDCFCAWSNYYNPRKKHCFFDIDLFEKTPEGVYTRKSETQKQKFFSETQIKKALKKQGFELIFRGADPDGGEVRCDSADIFYLAKCVKD